MFLFGIIICLCTYHRKQKNKKGTSISTLWNYLNWLLHAYAWYNMDWIHRSMCVSMRSINYNYVKAIPMKLLHTPDILFNALSRKLYWKMQTLSRMTRVYLQDIRNNVYNLLLSIWPAYVYTYMYTYTAVFGIGVACLLLCSIYILMFTACSPIVGYLAFQLSLSTCMWCGSKEEESLICTFYLLHLLW